MYRPLSIAVALVTFAPAAFAAEEMRQEPRAADGQVIFTVRIQNVSTSTTLRSSKGATAPAPNSPGVWIVHTGKRVLFAEGEPDRGAGLESQAEDGNPAVVAASLKAARGVTASGVFDTPLGDAMPGPALPGKAYQFTFRAAPGQRLTVATMFGQSNDLFFAPGEEGIALFESGKPIDGDITSRLYLWDAGTEVNEEPGFGPNQAPRQSAPNTGPTEREGVRRIDEVKDGFTYPRVDAVLRVTITPDFPAMVN
jgi:hypothetical protein